MKKVQYMFFTTLLACSLARSLARSLILQLSRARAPSKPRPSNCGTTARNINADIHSTYSTVPLYVVQEEGHVDGASLAAYVRAELRPGLCACLRLQLAEHAAFASIVLPAVSVDLEASSGASGASSASATGWGGAASTPRPLSQLLRGHEETLLALIADFAGVVRGRQLRNAREALTFLDG